MQIHTDLAPAGPYDDVVVLIDVLRTGTLAPMLLDLGLTRFALTGSVRRARQEAESDAAVLLMGERGGFPPERFNHGTSPAELRHLDVAGRSAVILTENAPRALAVAGAAPRVVLASLLNARAAAETASRLSRGKVYLVCSGFGGEPDLDDALAAGLIAGLLRDASPGATLTGATTFAVAMMRSYPDPIEALWHSAVGNFLRALGSDQDLGLAGAASVSPTAPVLAEVDVAGVAPLYRFARTETA
ncbi:MAG TPA: 2-phosphosulfolactate phosphatase [Trueperaceae bacterium]|nr:2-phosphosulfolactate phosphatase [Trueperaceae bacterium]